MNTINTQWVDLDYKSPVTVNCYSDGEEKETLLKIFTEVIHIRFNNELVILSYANDENTVLKFNFDSFDVVLPV